jgi:tetratricopeptide (TPR) repeat protein
MRLRFVALLSCACGLSARNAHAVQSTKENPSAEPFSTPQKFEEGITNVWFFWYRAADKLKKGNLDGAIADYSKAIELNPADPDAYDNRGVARLRKGDLDKAIADFNSAIELDPGRSIPYSGRGIARMRQGDSKAAIADFNKAVELDPNNIDARGNRWFLLYKDGRLDEALQDINKIVDHDPKLSKCIHETGHDKVRQRRQKGGGIRLQDGRHTSSRAIGRLPC